MSGFSSSSLFLAPRNIWRLGASRQRWWHLILAKNMFVQLGQPQKERRAPHIQHNLVPSATVWWSSACAIRHSSFPLLVWVLLWFFVFCSPLSLSLHFALFAPPHPPSNLTISSDPDACASDSWQRTFGSIGQSRRWSFGRRSARSFYAGPCHGISWQRRNASIHLVRLRHAYMACWYLKCWLLIGLRKIEDTGINSDWLRPEAHWPWRQLWSSFWRKEFAHETCNQISWNLQNASMCCCQWHGRHQQVGKIQSCWHTPSGWNTWTLVVFDVTLRIWQDVQVLYTSLKGTQFSSQEWLENTVKRTMCRIPWSGSSNSKPWIQQPNPARPIELAPNLSSAWNTMPRIGRSQMHL